MVACDKVLNLTFRAERRFGTILRARTAADHLFAELRNGLSDPPSRNQHQFFAGLLQAAQTHLPPPIDGSEPRPVHSEHPGQEEYNDMIVKTLAQDWKDVMVKLVICQSWCDWYRTLVAARENLLEDQTGIRGLRTDIKSAFNSANGGRPNLNDFTSLSYDYASRISSVHGHLERAETLLGSAVKTGQSATLSLMRYRQLLRASPKLVRAEMPVGDLQDPLIEEIEDKISVLLEVVRDGKADVKLSKQDYEIYLLASAMIKSSAICERVAEGLHEEIDEAISSTAWIAGESPHFARPFENDLQLLAQRTTDEVATPLHNLEELLKVYERTLPTLCLQLGTIASDLAERQKVLARRADLLARVQHQANIVRSLEEEATRLLSTLGYLRYDLMDIASQAVPASEAIMESIAHALEIKASEALIWEAGLASRTPFVSARSWDTSITSIPGQGTSRYRYTSLTVERIRRRHSAHPTAVTTCDS